MFSGPWSRMDAAVVVALRKVIPTRFVGGDAADAGATALAATLLIIGASFFVSDAIQGIAAGALRGLNDTRVPLFFAAVSCG
jgi:MATE family multidrug resistance protein